MANRRTKTPQSAQECASPAPVAGGEDAAAAAAHEARPEPSPAESARENLSGASKESHEATQHASSPGAEGTSAPASGGASRVLKKYPNRRLYDTQTSSYITLSDVKDMVLEALTFQVLDAKTGEDITRSILLQIILEEESGGVPMFSTAMLANIIRFYGHAMQGLMGNYLENNLQHFVDLQARLGEQAKGLYDPNRFSPDGWTQWMTGQGFMGNYLQQSQQLVQQMQERMQSAGTLFPGVPAPFKGDKD